MLKITQLCGFMSGGKSPPNVDATNTGTDSGTTVTSSSVNLPSGIASGNLLLVFATFDGPPGTITWPAGWTQLYAADNTAGSAAAYRIANGSEGASITVSWENARRTGWRSLRITGNHASNAPQMATANFTNSANPNPPNLSPSWGEDNTLWIATFHSRAATVSSYPSNYTDNQYNKTTNPSLGQATRKLLAAAEDPGTFTLSTTETGVASTVAVRPG